ncbi:MAG TPA: hypothetical protein VJM31_18490 [Vicinamibacterales bacterium]|nr:hypothetical protein [Vicinamibacterales bacterium]
MTLALLAMLLLLTASPVLAQQQSAASKFGRVLLGGAAGLAIHESGHLVANWAFDEKVVVKKVDYKGMPFFALSHAPDLSPRREYIVSSAGFWAQYLYSEQILTHHPNLKNERSPVRKGLLTFHVATSLVYAGAAFGKTGPIERDTRGMASSRRLSERWIGALVLAPAVLDAYRYFNPDARWATWAARGTKMGGVLLVIK